MSPLVARRWGSWCAARGGAAGVGLVELLLAASMAAVVLAMAWGWLWTLGAVAARTDNDAQASTAAAAALRAVTRDVRLATAVARPAAGRDPDCTLELRHDRLDRAPEDVVIAWDASRRVLWRNAPGTYLSDRVAAFSVTYVTAGGRSRAGSELGLSEWDAIRLVRVAITVEVGDRTVRRTVTVAPGPA